MKATLYPSTILLEGDSIFIQNIESGKRKKLNTCFVRKQSLFRAKIRTASGEKEFTGVVIDVRTDSGKEPYFTAYTSEGLSMEKPVINVFYPKDITEYVELLRFEQKNITENI